MEVNNKELDKYLHEIKMFKQDLYNDVAELYKTIDERKKMADRCDKMEIFIYEAIRLADVMNGKGVDNAK